MTDRLQVAIPLFPRFTALDAVGPYEVLQRIPTSTSPSSATNGARSGARTACSA